MPRTSIGELILMSTYGQRRDLLCVAICSPPLFFPFCVRFARHHNKDNLKTLCIRLYTIRYSIIIYPYGSKPCLGRYLTLQIIPQTLPKKVLGSIGKFLHVHKLMVNPPLLDEPASIRSIFPGPYTGTRE